MGKWRHSSTFYFHQRKSPDYPLNGRVGEPWSWSRQLEEEKKHLLLPGIQKQFPLVIQPVASLYQLLYCSSSI